MTIQEKIMRIRHAGLWALLVTTALLTPASSGATLGSSGDSPACCQLTTSLAMDALRGRDIPGDERFFTAEAGAPPNIHFILSNSLSMQHLPIIQSVTDLLGYGVRCENTLLNDDMNARGWTAADAVPYVGYGPIDTGTGLGSDSGFPDLFLEGRYYGYLTWGTSTSPAYVGAANGVTAGEAKKACVSQFGMDPLVDPRAALCADCLVKRGYYIKEGATTSAGVLMSGRYLNFNPPKHVIARKALKSVVASMQKFRFGLTTYESGSTPFGGTGISKQFPQCHQIVADSTNWSSQRGSAVNSINGISFTAEHQPLAETLLNVGQFFSSDDDIYEIEYEFGSGYTKNAFTNSVTSKGRSVCWGCQYTSVVIISDGVPSHDANIPTAKLEAHNGEVVDCELLGCPAENADYKLDDLAKFLHENDLQITNPPQVKNSDFNSAGKQSLVIYGVGFGADNPLLRSAAGVGGGEYLTVKNERQLEEALQDLIRRVETRATAFSAAAISSFQINRTGGSLIPRFRPSAQPNRPWAGFVFRFELGNERDLGCEDVRAREIAVDGTGGDPNDLNRDGKCNSLYLIDSEGEPVIEDDSGNFVRFRDTLTPAVPAWEANAQLHALRTTSEQAWERRRIYTITDANGDGRIDSEDPPTLFSVANAAALREYLGIPTTTTTSACAAISERLYGTGVTVMDSVECAETIIKYYRGADALNFDPALRGLDRPNLLQDIFHSAPIQVEPPITKEFCEWSNQCVASLYGTATELATYGELDAYDEYVRLRGSRDKIAVVGSNGGMLHALQSGVRKSGLEGTDEATGLPIYSSGTGKELWAFVPPDMLPKLRPNIGRHGYFVDGSAMVREVWIDGSGGELEDGVKQADEFRTVVVVGSGAGGVHRFALDLTDHIAISASPSSPSLGTAPDQGFFMWMWPQPCDELALQLGEAFSNFAPKPPPIGPVAIAPSGSEDGTDAVRFPLQVGTQRAKEQWIVFLNGGHDHYMTRGRGFAMVDIATGATLWKKFYGDGAALSGELKYPISAGVGMMDGGSLESAVLQDGLFDSATVGDYGGQLWVIRFWEPGEIDTATGLVTNWHAARAFKAQADANQVANPNWLREPISQITSNTFDPIAPRLLTYVGTGDRQNMTDVGGPHCRVSNPRGCAQLGCSVGAEVTVQRGGSTAWTSVIGYSGAAFSGSSSSASSTTGSCSSSALELRWRIAPGGSCAADFTVDAFGNTPRLQYVCDGVGDAFNCRNTDNDWIPPSQTEPLDYKLATPPANTARFYGIFSYGQSRLFNTALGALSFDSLKLNDSGAGALTLADVTHSGPAGADETDTSKQNVGNGNGWFIAYQRDAIPTDERTATSSTIIGGCVIWNSMEASINSGPICATSGTNVARLYQSSIVEGLPNCGEGFKDADGNFQRFLSRNTVAVPGEPAALNLISHGLSELAAVTIEAGNTEATVVSSNDELLQSVFQIELSPREHSCRHEGVNCP